MPSTATLAHAPAGNPAATASPRARKRAADVLASTQCAVETFHEERRVVVAKRPAGGDDDAGARGEERAGQAQRALSGQQRPIRRLAGRQHDQPAAELQLHDLARLEPAVFAFVTRGEKNGRPSRKCRIRSRMRGQMEDAERREREVFQCALRRRMPFEDGIQLRRTGHGVPAPGQFAVQWERMVGRYPSGEPYVLRTPRVRVSDLAYGPLDSRTRLALRVPLAVFGLGLLEGVPDREILTSADPDDADKDGLSGRAQRVRHPATGSMVVGRFGWKASQPSLAAQSAAALENDLGVANAGESELSALVGYLRALAVPARRRSTEPVVRAGEALFAEIGCADCHRPRLTTGVVAGWPELTHQTIAAYTNLLLHDMGAGLADEIGEGVASGREWRTPPLWGLGLLHTVGSPVGLLHDGRAASVEEAILWHDGEAARTRQRFLAMPRTKREALIVFLSSL